MTTKLYKPTKERQRLLDVLDDGVSYSVTDLCIKAGVTRTVYYDAIKDDNFVATLFHTTSGKIYAAMPAIMAKVVKQAEKGSFAHQKMLFEMMKIYQGVPTHQTNIQVNVKPIYGGKSIEGTGDVTQDNDRVRAITITSKPLNQSSDTTAPLDVKDSVDSTQENE